MQYSYKSQPYLPCTSPQRKHRKNGHDCWR